MTNMFHRYRKSLTALFILLALLLNVVYLSRMYHSHADSSYFRSDMGQIYFQQQPKQARNLMQTLPCFAVDDSEYILGSVLELGSQQHYVVVFMLSHLALSRSDDRNIGPDRVHKNFVKQWQRAKLGFSGVPYSHGQRRDTYYCRVSQGDITKVLPGSFVKNGYSIASEVGDIDILRCPLAAFVANTSHAVIEVLRGDFSLVNFSLPLSHRRTGYLLPPSQFHAWISPTTPGPHIAALIYGLSASLHIRLVAYILQLLQHHISIGVSHIFFFTSYAPHSDDFIKLQLLCRPFIEARQLSIISEAHDNIHRVSSSHMMTLRKASLSNLRSNMYLYLLKHHFEYMGVWHMDQFFLPQRPYDNINSLLRSLYELKVNYIVPTDLIIERNPNKKYDFQYPWLDRAYNHSITVPLNVTEYSLVANTQASHSILLPYVIECERNGDALPGAAPPILSPYMAIERMSNAIMYIFETKHKGHDNMEAMSVGNDYTARYAANVNNHLRRKNLDLLAQIVVSEEEEVLGINSEKWPKFAML